MQVPFLDLKPQYQSLRTEIMAEIGDICDSQMFILGEKVQRLEQELAAYCGGGYACGVTSGSDALIIALMAENIGPGDEVITSPFTFFATAGAICRVGATPVFADIEQQTFNIDPNRIAEKITARTKAIIPVHLFGQSADMDRIMELAREHGLAVIEDACQAIGSEYRGKRVGLIGDYGCFSFFPSKNLGAFGDGGIVTTGSEEKVNKLRILRNHGMEPRYYHKYVGGNFRLDAIQAAILSIKLRHLDDWSDARIRNAAEYRQMFISAGIGPEQIALPMEAAYCTRHIYNQFSILVGNGKRDALRNALHDAGIGCDIYYPVPLHLQECFAGLGGKCGDMPNSEQACRDILALPIFPEATTEQRAYVVDTIRKFMS